MKFLNVEDYSIQKEEPYKNKITIGDMFEIYDIFYNLIDLLNFLYKYIKNESRNRKQKISRTQ